MRGFAIGPSLFETAALRSEEIKGATRSSHERDECAGRNRITGTEGR